MLDSRLHSARLENAGPSFSGGISRSSVLRITDAEPQSMLRPCRGRCWCESVGSSTVTELTSSSPGGRAGDVDSSSVWGGDGSGAGGGDEVRRTPWNVCDDKGREAGEAGGAGRGVERMVLVADGGDAMELGIGDGGRCWRPMCKPDPGHFHAGWLQPVLASPCGVVVDLTSHLLCPLLSPHLQASQEPQDN